MFRPRKASRSISDRSLCRCTLIYGKALSEHSDNITPANQGAFAGPRRRSLVLNASHTETKNHRDICPVAYVEFDTSNSFRLARSGQLSNSLSPRISVAIHFFENASRWPAWLIDALFPVLNGRNRNTKKLCKYRLTQS